MELKISDSQKSILEKTYQDFLKFEDLEIKQALLPHIKNFQLIKRIKNRTNVMSLLDEGQEQAEVSFHWHGRPEYFKQVETILDKIKANNLNFDEAEMYNIRNVTDITTRFGQGELKAVRDVFSNVKNLNIGSFVSVIDIFDKASKEMGGYLKIQQLNEDYKIVHDFHQVIRHHLAWKRKPDGGEHVDFEKPKTYSNQDPPYIHDEEILKAKTKIKARTKMKP